MERGIDPYEMTVEDFLKMDKEEQQSVFKKAAEINRPFAQEYFQNNPEVGWIIIAKEPKNIILVGEGDAPSNEQWDDVVRSQGTIVFTYTRLMAVD